MLSSQTSAETWAKIVEKCEKDDNYKKHVVEIILKAESGALSQEELKKISGGQRCAALAMKS